MHKLAAVTITSYEAVFCLFSFYLNFGCYDIVCVFNLTRTKYQQNNSKHIISISIEVVEIPESQSFAFSAVYFDCIDQHFGVIKMHMCQCVHVLDALVSILESCIFHTYEQINYLCVRAYVRACVRVCAAYTDDIGILFVC